MSLTLELPAETQARLEAEASRRGISLAQLIVEVAQGFSQPASGPRRRPSFIGIGASGRTEPLDIHKERAELAQRKLDEGI